MMTQQEAMKLTRRRTSEQVRAAIRQMRLPEPDYDLYDPPEQVLDEAVRVVGKILNGGG